MKKIFLPFFILSALVFQSCQKEVEDTIGNSSTGNTAGTKLVKAVTRSGSDSTVVNYTYNTSGKLSGFLISGVDSGQAIDLRVNFVRASSGIIQKRVVKTNDLAAFGIDSIVSIIGFDAGNNRYKNIVTTTSFFGLNFKDSVAFNFDGTGKLASKIDYSNDGSGGPYEISSKIDYDYGGNNILSQKFYSYDDASRSFTLEETDSYEYDSKTNPLQFASEAFILDFLGEDFYSANNYIKVTIVAPGSSTVTTSISYTYNAASKPATATAMSGSSTTTTTYTYQ